MNTLASRFALFALALGTISLAPVALAQDSSSGGGGQSSHQHGAPDPQKQAARLASRLGLSDDQSAKITTILQNQQQQISALRSDSSLSQDDRHAKMHSIRQDTDTQINAVLTPAQQTQYANMKQQMAQHMHNGGGGSGN
jgi:periplasmic protein CpxP/Spy